MEKYMNLEIANDHRQILAASEQLQVVVNGTGSKRVSVAYSAEGSIDESEPPSPTAGPPANFAEVLPGIYRSSFPKMGNFEYLGTLGLKTILTLVDEPYPAENKAFIMDNGINHVQIPIPANKNPSDVIPPHLMAGALELLLDPRYHPLLIHCNKGKHRTGCVVGCYRKMNGISMDVIIDEYHKYAGVKARTLDEKFIENFDEGAMYVILDDIVLSKAKAQKHSLVTPPASLKDEYKDDATVAPKERKGASKANSTVLL